jgi:hypothetical protein
MSTTTCKGLGNTYNREMRINQVQVLYSLHYPALPPLYFRLSLVRSPNHSLTHSLTHSQITQSPVIAASAPLGLGLSPSVPCMYAFAYYVLRASSLRERRSSWKQVDRQTSPCLAPGCLSILRILTLRFLKFEVHPHITSPFRCISRKHIALWIHKVKRRST